MSKQAALAYASVSCVPGATLRWRASRLAAGLGLLAPTLLAPGVPAASAAAPPMCAPRADILQQLSKRYSEAPVAIGLANDGSLVEVLTSDGGSTWTIIFSKPNGSSCLMAAGESWQDMKRLPGEMGI